MIAADLAATYAVAFPDARPWTAAEFAALLDQSGVILCGDAKSFVLGRVILDEAEIITLATHPDFQRQGRAQTQLSAFLDAASVQGVTSVFLEVAEDNETANILYSNNKFRNIGHRPNYYTRPDGTKVGADILRRAL